MWLAFSHFSVWQPGGLRVELVTIRQQFSFEKPDRVTSTLHMVDFYVNLPKNSQQLQGMFVLANLETALAE